MPTTNPSPPPDFTDRNRFERWSFAGTSASVDVGATVGWYPNLEIADASVSVVVAGRQRTVHASERLRPDADGGAAIGPIRLGPADPDGSRRLTVDDVGTGLACDLTLEPRSVAVDEPAHLERRGAVTAVDTVRTSRAASWSGEVALDGPPSSVAGAGGLSRSAGVRPLADEGGRAPARELPEVFWWRLSLTRGDTWLVATGRAPSGSGAAVADDAATTPVAATLDVSWEPGTRRARRAVLELGASAPPSLPSTISLAVHRWSPLRALGYTSPDWPHGRWHGEDVVGVEDWAVADLDPTDVHHLLGRHVVGATVGDQHAIGTLDLLALGPHPPTGLTGFTDGAR